MEDNEQQTRKGVFGMEGKVNGRGGARTVLSVGPMHRLVCLKRKLVAFSPIPAFPLFRVALSVQSPSRSTTNTPQLFPTTCTNTINLTAPVSLPLDAGLRDGLWTLCGRTPPSECAFQPFTHHTSSQQQNHPCACVEEDCNGRLHLLICEILTYDVQADLYFAPWLS